MWWLNKKRKSEEDYFSLRNKHHRFYSSVKWQKLRLYKLSIDPLCERCLPIVLEPAVVVDHIQSLTDRYDLRLVLENLQSLCKHHHDLKTNEEKREYIKRLKENLINDRMSELEEF
jgi:5-methylcytosine-specific restriction endonuclease McrA